tara:strand:- start:685 stop:3132 length:2448 start_codon:yes stop_codon:yes gene_type:complete
MNPYKLKEVYKYLTRAKKADPSLPDVFSASKAPIPAKTQNVEEIEAINRFNKDNPRIEKAGGGRIGFADGPPGFQPGNQMNLRRRDGNSGNIQALEKIMKEKTAVKDKKVNKFVELVEKGDTTTEAKNKVIQLFKLDRSKKAGTPPWMTQGKNILIDKGILKSKEKTTQETLGKTENLTSNQDIKKIDTQVKRPAPNIKEVKYKNIKTGETFSRFKPVIGESNKTVSGSGFKTLKEAKKIVDNYFKENPKQIRVRDPQKNYNTKDRRAKALEETDRTKAAGTKKYNYHHIRQIAGGVPLTTDDVMIINQRINSKIGGKFNESLNRISTAIQKNNKLALEAMNNKQEGLALDYMKRSDELNAQAEKIVNSAIDDLPEKYKSYVGFNKFTLPRDEYGLPISNEPMIIKKVGGMPVSEDAIDLTTLDLKQEKEFRKTVKAQAEKGEVGSIKIQADILKKMGFKCKFAGSNGGAAKCDDPASYVDDIKKTRSELNSSDVAVRAAANAKLNKGLQVAKTLPTIGKFLRRVGQATVGGVSKALQVSGFGTPVGLAIEGIVEGGIYDYYLGQGYTEDQAYQETFFPGMITGRPEGVPWYGGAESLLEKKLVGDPQQNPKVLQYQQALKDQEQVFDAFGRKEQGLQASRKDITDAASADIQDLNRSGTISNINRIMNPESMASQAYNTAIENQAGRQDQRARDYKAENYMNQDTTQDFDDKLQKKRNEEMLQMFPPPTVDTVRDVYTQYGIEDRLKNFMAQDYKDEIKRFDDYQKQSYFADNFRLEKAGGGIAKIAGIDQGPPPVKGPNSQGLQGLLKRGIKI